MVVVDNNAIRLEVLVEGTVLATEGDIYCHTVYLTGADEKEMFWDNTDDAVKEVVAEVLKHYPTGWYAVSSVIFHTSWEALELLK